MPTIRDEWEEFRRLVIHPDASQEQHEEMRRSFYAGALAVLAVIGNSGSEVDYKAWTKLFTEAHRFGQDQIRQDQARAAGERSGG